MNEMLTAMGDTTLLNDRERYLNIATDEGFEVVLALPFEGHLFSEAKQETYYILFNKIDGILLSFDTFGGGHVNGGSFYYNWRPNRKPDGTIYYPPHYSGRWEGSPEAGCFVVHTDCREALRHNLATLRSTGTFVTPWYKQGFLWLLHYMDTHDNKGNQTRDYDYKAITAARIAMLPDYVQQAIRGSA